MPKTMKVYLNLLQLCKVNYRLFFSQTRCIFDIYLHCQLCISTNLSQLASYFLTVLTIAAVLLGMYQIFSLAPMVERDWSKFCHVLCG